MDYLFHVLVIAGIYMILALSLNLILGYTGLPAVGHGAFACVGAYTSSLLALKCGVSPWLGLLFGAAAAAVMSLLVAVPALRLKGDYLALASFGFAVIVYSVAKNWIALTRGPMGLPGIPRYSIAGHSISQPWAYLILVGMIVWLVAFVLKQIVDSPFGRVLRGIREDEIATSSIGRNVARYKVQAILIGAFFAGMSGSLYAHYIGFIDPSSFTVMESITILLMVVFGGMGRLRGSFVGATVLVVLPETLRFLGLPSAIAAPLRQMIYGFLLTLLMVKRPQGLLGNYRFR